MFDRIGLGPAEDWAELALLVIFEITKRTLQLHIRAHTEGRRSWGLGS